MQNLLQRLSGFTSINRGQNLFLVLITIFAYGLQLPWLHLYIDDWIWAWTWEYYGADGVQVYFSTNRPVWGMLYQITLPLLDGNVLAYQIFGLLCRLLATLIFFWLLRQIWPESGKLVFSASLIFAIYPGFALHPIAITYGHIFIVMSFWFLSIGFSLQALQKPPRRWLLILLSGLFSILNLLMMEYFFTLEILRLFIFGMVFFRTEPNLSKLLLKTLQNWAVYGATLIAAILVRSIFLTQIQTNRYSFRWLDSLKTSPLQAIGQLIIKIGEDLWQTTLGAWEPVIRRFSLLDIRYSSTWMTIILSGFIFSLALLFWIVWKNNTPAKRSWFEMVWLGLFAILAAGWPFWLTSLDVKPVEIYGRFTLPFMVGASLLISGLINGLPNRTVQAVLLAAFVGTAAGFHFQISNDFRLEWKYNQQLIWQIRWRIPHLEEGTTLLLTDFPTNYYNLAALTTELNALYPYEPQPRRLAYAVNYSRNLDEELEGLQPGLTLTGRNVTARLNGSTDQLLAAQYDLGRCFRLTEPDLDGQDPSLPGHLQRASRLSDLRWVETNPSSFPVREDWFTPEPEHTWCYYFEKADLARQEKKWNEVINYWDQAHAKGYTPRDEMEKILFIEAFAQTNQWQIAQDLALSFSLSERKNVLCRLADRIDHTTPPSLDKTKFLDQVYQFAACSMDD